MAPISNPTIPQEAPRPGVLAWVAGLVKAGLARVAFPFDAILTGMVAAGICLDGLCAFLGLTRDGLFAHIVRLDLPTPADKPLRRPSARSWSIEDTQKLIVWRASGIHPEVIAQGLSRTLSTNAVRSKARRLGLAAPPRKQLFRPSIEQLVLPLPMPSVSRPSPAASSPRSGQDAAPSSPKPVAPRSSPSAPPSQCGRDATASAPVPPRPANSQAEAARPAPASSRSQPQPSLPGFPHIFARAEYEVVPTRLDQVDFSDVLWIGRLTGGRGNRADASQSIRTNPAAVETVGYLTASGLSLEAAADRIGKPVTAYKDIRTRSGFPQIDGRSAKTDVFDFEVASETIKRANLIVVQSMAARDGRPPKFFWRVATDRHVRFAPGERPRNRRGEAGAAPLRIPIITREILDAETRFCGRIPMSGSTIIPARTAQSSPSLSFKPPQPPPTRTARPPIVLPTSAAFATLDARLGS